MLGQKGIVSAKRGRKRSEALTPDRESKPGKKKKGDRKLDLLGRRKGGRRIILGGRAGRKTTDEGRRRVERENLGFGEKKGRGVALEKVRFGRGGGNIEEKRNCVCRRRKRKATKIKSHAPPAKIKHEGKARAGRKCAEEREKRGGRTTIHYKKKRHSILTKRRSFEREERITSQS